MIEGTEGRGQIGIDSSMTRRPAEPHWLVQAGLVAAAVALSVWNWDGAQHYTLRTLNDFSGGPELEFDLTHELSSKRLTPEQRLVLEGDTSRSTRHERHRALWETHPENRVYLGNYVTALAADASSDSMSIESLRDEMAAARNVEPENARFDYFEAGQLLKAASEIKSQKTGMDEEGKSRMEYSLEVRSREQLDEAMVLFREGLGKPYWRRYTADMLEEQLAVLGPPRRFVHLVERTAIAAATLLPDLIQVRSLARTARLYADLLIREGKAESAVPYLEAWSTLSRQLTEDSFTLIDMLVVGAIVKDAEQTIPPLYRQIGRDGDADRTASNAAMIAKPVNDWRAARVHAREQVSQGAGLNLNERELEARAGVLVSMLLPALGQWPDVSEYEPGRMLEYTVFTEFLVAAICGAFLIAMLVSLLLALRWWLFRPGTASAPFLLMPGVGATTRIIVFGVLLPLGLFFLVTRYIPGSGHGYSVRVGLPKLLAEFGLLVGTLAILPVLMILAQVKRRCHELGMAVTRWHARYLTWPLALLGGLLLAVAWFLPPTSNDPGKALVSAGLVLIGAALALGILLGVAQGLAGQAQYGAFYGASFRTLGISLAVIVVVLGVSTQPLLKRAEAGYIERDTLMYDRDRAGFTRLENDLVEQLRTAIIGNFKALEKSGRQSP